MPAVVDLVRRAVESRGSVDLVYLDLGRSGWHEARLGWAAYDEETLRIPSPLLGRVPVDGAMDPALEHAPERVPRIAVRHQVVGHLIQQLVRIEVDALRAVPSRIAAAPGHGR